MKQQLIFRQGDVLLIAVSAIPAGAKDITPTDNIILALGEATGHAHAVQTSKRAPKAKLWDAGAERFLQVMEATSLRHEEHSEIPLPLGKYQVILQTEYHPQELRRVSD